MACFEMSLIFIFFAIFIDCFQYFYGYLAFQSGLSTISGSIVELGDLFQNFTIIGNNLETAGKGVETTGKLTGICPGNMTDGFFEVMSGIGGILADAAGAANSGTKDLPGVMYDGGEYVDYAKVQSGVYLTMFFAFSMANLFVLLLAGPLCKSKHLLQLMILVAGILVILLTIICCVEMILVVSLNTYSLSLSISESKIPCRFLRLTLPTYIYSVFCPSLHFFYAVHFLHMYIIQCV